MLVNKKISCVKVFALSGSPCKNGNSDILCDEFARGAVEAGHEVKKIRVAEKNVDYCRACDAFRDTGVCSIKDDMTDIMQEMIDCNVMVLASPVYFYSVSAQLKAVIDLMLPVVQKSRTRSSTTLLPQLTVKTRLQKPLFLAFAAMLTVLTVQKKWASSTAWAFMRRVKLKLQKQ